MFRWRHLAFVAVVGVLGAAVSLQGWRSSLPSDDSIPYIDAARALIRDGHVPDRGNTTHFFSFTPPGYAWVEVPGVAWISDVRLMNLPGDAALHLATLLGVFLLAQSCVGFRCAVLSVLFYAFGWPGLKFAPGGFETRALPVFYVWIAYWTCVWVTRRDTRYLFGALMSWAVGMYVHMELAPALFIVPVVWFIYRPPVSVRVLVFTAALALLVWSPYLRLEFERGFKDVRSQVLLQTLTLVPPPSGPGCEVSAAPASAGASPADALEPEGRGGVAKRILEIMLGLMVNMNGLVPGTGLLLLALIIAGVVMLSVRTGSQEEVSGRTSPPRPWLNVLAIGLVVLAGLANEIAIGALVGAPLRDSRAMLRALQVTTAGLGIAILKRRSIAARLRRLARPQHQASSDPRILVLSLLVPWVVLLALTEVGHLYRLAGLWPLQAIVLAAFVAAVSSQMNGRLQWIVPGTIAILLLLNPVMAAHVDSWRRDGWAGRAGDEERVADLLAARLRSDGRDDAVIGYSPVVGPGDRPTWNEDDRTGPLFGQQIDVALEYHHGVMNRTRCWQRLSSDDEYRVVEAPDPTREATMYFGAPPTNRPLVLLEQFGRYSVYAAPR